MSPRLTHMYRRLSIPAQSDLQIIALRKPSLLCQKGTPFCVFRRVRGSPVNGEGRRSNWRFADSLATHSSQIGHLQRFSDCYSKDARSTIERCASFSASCQQDHPITGNIVRKADAKRGEQEPAFGRRSSS